MQLTSVRLLSAHFAERMGNHEPAWFMKRVPHPQLIVGCPTLAAFLFLRLGWLAPRNAWVQVLCYFLVNAVNV